MSAPARPRTVLIVDDHPVYRATVRLLLESGGFEVVGEAADGRAALDLVIRVRPELVLLDVRLPDVDGIDVASRMSRGPEPPAIILISSRSAIDYGERLALAPVAGFIPKARLSASAIEALLG